MFLDFNISSINKCQKDYKERSLAIYNNVLTNEGNHSLVQECIRLQPHMEKNTQLRQVHSGKLHELKSSFIDFGLSKKLTHLVNQIVGEDVSPCHGSMDKRYSLYRNDFGTKLNFYDGDDLGSIGWHYDKETSWVNDTIVVIYTILFRKHLSIKEDRVPELYQIIENYQKKSFEIAENSLHIHNTKHVYHRAVIPKGWKRWVYILHFTKSPCIPNLKKEGYSMSLIWRNIVTRTYVELCIEYNILLWIFLIIVLLYVLVKV